MIRVRSERRWGQGLEEVCVCVWCVGVGGLHYHVMSDPEREPSVLCHGCWGTPPFALNFPISLSSSLPHPPFFLPLLCCCGCIFCLEVTDTGLYTATVCIPSMNMSICTFTAHTYHVFSHSSCFFYQLLSAFQLLAPNDSPPPAFD